jgi:hypothetical protein
MATADSLRQSPRWNVISVLMPPLGFLVALLSWLSGLFETLGVGSHPMDQGAAALGVWCGFGPPGLAAAIIALVRREQLRGITAAAFVLNGPLAVGFLTLGGSAGDARDHLAPYVASACAALVFVGVAVRGASASAGSPTWRGTLILVSVALLGIIVVTAVILWLTGIL